MPDKIFCLAEISFKPFPKMIRNQISHPTTPRFSSRQKIFRQTECFVLSSSTKINYLPVIFKQIFEKIIFIGTHLKRFWGNSGF
jgi:hypothetical protein